MKDRNSKKEEKNVDFGKKNVDNGGFDPPTSRMLSVRSVPASQIFEIESKKVGIGYQLS